MTGKAQNVAHVLLGPVAYQKQLKVPLRRNFTFFFGIFLLQNNLPVTVMFTQTQKIISFLHRNLGFENCNFPSAITRNWFQLRRIFHSGRTSCDVKHPARDLSFAMFSLFLWVFVEILHENVWRFCGGILAFRVKFFSNKPRKIM